MLTYVVVVCLIYLVGVAGDYISTEFSAKNSGEEINPVFRNRSGLLLLYPFLFATPLVALFAAGEFYYFRAGAYYREGWALNHAHQVYAQLASLGVFASLALTAHKIVASFSNLSVIARGPGLPGLISTWLPWLPRRLFYPTIILASLLVVLPLIMLLRWLIRLVL